MLAVPWQLSGKGAVTKDDTACCLVALTLARCCLTGEAELNVKLGVPELAAGRLVMVLPGVG